MSESATLSKEGDISTITLDDGKVNVFSLEMLESIQKSLDQVSKDSGALIIRGREGIFSAGFDLKTFQSGDAEKAQKMTALGMKTMHDLYTFPRPVIMAVTGHAIAMGIFIVCCGDYRIALEGEFVAQANEVRNNMDIPSPIMEVAESRIDKKHVYSVLYHADPYPFDKCIEAGLLDEIASSSDFEKRIMEKAEDLASLGHPHYAKTKQAHQRPLLEAISNALPA